MKPRLVMIDWVDSAQPLGAWRFLDSLPPIDAVICKSVGWLVGQTKLVKMLAPNVALDDKGGYEQGSGFIRIPVRCIVRIKNL